VKAADVTNTGTQYWTATPAGCHETDYSVQ